MCFVCASEMSVRARDDLRSAAESRCRLDGVDDPVSSAESSRWWREKEEVVEESAACAHR
jgi:hypothetical protein